MSVQRRFAGQSGAAPWRDVMSAAASLATPVLLSAAILGVVVLGTQKLVRAAFRVELGDIITVGPDADGPQLPDMDIDAVVVAAPGLAPGSHCTLGTGALAAQGGTLIIVRQDPDGAFVASWAGPGRSSKLGQDCGSRADLRLAADDVEAIEFAPFLESSVASGT